eukprot:m.66389 g.66389  ORF g.66389 m.66389 type:complete len:141 (-) comp12114_c0_seq2:46-468(-)
MLVLTYCHGQWGSLAVDCLFEVWWHLAPDLLFALGHQIHFGELHVLRLDLCPVNGLASLAVPPFVKQLSFFHSLWPVNDKAHDLATTEQLKPPQASLIKAAICQLLTTQLITLCITSTPNARKQTRGVRYQRFGSWLCLC